MTTIYLMIIASMMNIYFLKESMMNIYVMCFFQSFFITNFYLVLFLKHIFKANYFFNFIYVSGPNISLVFLCINDKHFSRIFPFFLTTNIYLTFFMHPTNILSHDFFIFSYSFVMKYVPHFFYLSL